MTAAGGSGKAIHGDAWMLDTEDEAAINPSLSDQSLLSQLAAIQVTCSEYPWASGGMGHQSVHQSQAVPGGPSHGFVLCSALRCGLWQLCSLATSCCPSWLPFR